MTEDKEIRRAITRLYKDYLVVLEDLQQEHQAAFSRVMDQMPEEYQPLLFSANYFDDEKMRYLRKRILDLGNDALRDVEDRISIHFSFKNQ